MCEFSASERQLTVLEAEGLSARKVPWRKAAQWKCVAMPQDVFCGQPLRAGVRMGVRSVPT